MKTNWLRRLGISSLLAFSTLPPAQAQTACPGLLDHQFVNLQDGSPMPLCQYAGKVILVVNTASKCAFTSQYEGLEKLYARLKDRGLVVLGFPSNDFGEQEPGNDKQIAEFCRLTMASNFQWSPKPSSKAPAPTPSINNWPNAPAARRNGISTNT